jgi:hypothetical protein
MFSILLPRLLDIWKDDTEKGRSQWARGLRRGSAASCLRGVRVRILPNVWMSVSCDNCVVSGRGLCDGLITRPEESYRVWCVWVWSWNLCNEEALDHWGLLHLAEKIKNCFLRLFVRMNLRTVWGYSWRETFFFCNWKRKEFGLPQCLIK